MKIGDTVSVIDDVINGIVCAIEEDFITLVTEDGFEFQYTKNEVVVMGGFNLEIEKNMPSISTLLSEKQYSYKPKKIIKISKRKSKVNPPLEVDLHIEKLVPHPKKIDSYEILSFQLEIVRKRLQFAFDKKIQRVIFIHGVGTGVLKIELQFLLKKYENLKFYDADYAKYGLGATEVYIFQNKTKGYS